MPTPPLLIVLSEPVELVFECRTLILMPFSSVELVGVFPVRVSFRVNNLLRINEIILILVRALYVAHKRYTLLQ